MRQIVLDTETTGLTLAEGHRIIEIGCVELVNRRHTGRHFHRYLNPEREVDAGAIAVHGLTRERLDSSPRFAEIAAELLEFVRDAELIIHNAEFDVSFIDMELGRLARLAEQVDEPAARPASVRTFCRVLDTLTLARERHPGQRNNLDALCKRYGIDNAHRDLHGALLDAQLLADVYLAMTGGQSLLALEQEARSEAQIDGIDGAELPRLLLTRSGEALRVVVASAEELAAHTELLKVLQKASGGRCLWLAMPAQA
ncbi:MAG TPA: DNA polymerase III subunit epsilon [Steroidobacteraceae bacterium]|jgi:DNA polymerase-3 subunit epsilon|nr:DNA polymerase III subunit epsilon [Steroidobacteraceae bacterium]